MEDGQHGRGVRDPVGKLAVYLLPLGDVGGGDTGVPQLVHRFVVELVAFVLDVERTDGFGVGVQPRAFIVAVGSEAGGEHIEALRARHFEVGSRVEAVDVAGQPDVGKVALEHLGHLFEVSARRAVDGAEVRSLGVGGFRNVLLGLFGVVVVDDALRRRSGVLRRDHEVGLDGVSVVAGDVHGFLVDRVGDGEAYVVVVKRRVQIVDGNEGDVIRRDELRLERWIRGERAPVGDGSNVPVQLARFEGDQARRGFDDGNIVDLLDGRRAAVVVGKGLADPLDVVLELGEVVRARAGQGYFGAELASLFFDFLPAYDHDVGLVVEERRVGLL